MNINIKRKVEARKRLGILRRILIDQIKRRQMSYDTRSIINSSNRLPSLEITPP